MNKYCLLIVSKNTDFCALLKEYFELEGYRVETANSENQAATLIETEIPNVVILDYETFSDFEFRLRVYDKSKTSQIPFIYVLPSHIPQETVNHWYTNTSSYYGVRYVEVDDYIVGDLDVVALKLSIQRTRECKLYQNDQKK